MNRIPAHDKVIGLAPVEAEWTVSTLQVHVAQQLFDMRLQLDERAAAQHEAIAVANIATEKRFDSVNEFRQVLSDQAATFMTRHDFDNLHERLSERVDEVARRMAALQLAVSTRLDLTTGGDAALAQAAANRRSDRAIVVAAVSVVITAIGVATAILVASGH